ARVAAEAWPPMRDAEELHEALCGLGVLPANEHTELFARLVGSNRAAAFTVDGREFWVAAERFELVGRVYGGQVRDLPAGMSGSGTCPTVEACAAQILRGWFECSGPRRAADLARELAMPRDLVDQALAQLEAEGQILRGHFTARNELEWCHRRLLARIHRLTIGRLRREIEPVTTATYYAFLHRWQHLSPGSQLHGVDGTLQIIRQLQGSELPAAAWEAEALPGRIAHYEPDYLDQLCLSGEVTWGRLSPHPAFERDEEERHARVRPTRVAPLAIFLREDAPWLLAGPQPSSREALSHPAREVLAALESRGASFFADLTHATGRLNLRALLDPKRRAGQGKGRTARPRHAPGRWALLRHTDAPPEGHREAFVQQLLRRWGVVFRDVAVREPLAPAWRDLLVVLRRLEARGEIRGGRFVSVFIGEQFALPEALDLLRAVRRAGETAAATSVLAATTVE
ncbi:MAG: DEAD/DEAH box helicase, partial [Acidobacteriia bacterium]|nr:DEAD/DEAH box helicase [Terriglobia bacterium]